MYSIEFCTSISLLQALFIGVTVISCQKSSEFAEVSNLFEEKVFQGLKNANDETKNFQEHSTANGGSKKISTIFQGEAPVKYTPCPPLSPVGRV